jgi:hypothetical protein
MKTITVHYRYPVQYWSALLWVDRPPGFGLGAVDEAVPDALLVVPGDPASLSRRACIEAAMEKARGLGHGEAAIDPGYGKGSFGPFLSGAQAVMHEHRGHSLLTWRINDTM